MSRKNSRPRWWQRQEGAVAVEFALIITLLVMIFGAVIDFGHYLYLKNLANNASREGARMGIVYNNRPSATQIQSYIQQKYGAYLTVQVTNAGGASGSDLTVRVSCPKQWFFLGPLVGSSPELLNPSGTTVMRLE